MRSAREDGSVNRDRLTARTRIARAQRLRDCADRVGWDRAAAHVGEVQRVLSEGLDDDGVAVGRWRGQAPDVDGVVLLDRPVPKGTFVEVSFTDSICYDLEVEVLA